MPQLVDTVRVDRQASAATSLVTRTGVVLTIREATGVDVQLMADIYAHLTAQDMRFRFKGSIDKLDLDDLRALVDTGAGMTSYLAFSGDTPVACATLMRDPGQSSAEVILSVRPDWKGRGVSWSLLGDVLARAAAQGLTRVSSTESGEDGEAVNLQREMGFVARVKSADPIEYLMVKALS